MTATAATQPTGESRWKQRVVRRDLRICEGQQPDAAYLRRLSDTKHLDAEVADTLADFLAVAIHERLDVIGLPVGCTVRGEHLHLVLGRGQVFKMLVSSYSFLRSFHGRDLLAGQLHLSAAAGIPQRVDDCLVRAWALADQGLKSLHGLPDPA